MDATAARLFVGLAVVLGGLDHDGIPTWQIGPMVGPRTLRQSSSALRMARELAVERFNYHRHHVRRRLQHDHV